MGSPCATFDTCTLLKSLPVFRRAIFQEQFAQDFGLLLIGRFHQLGKCLLLFIAQNVPVRMIPIRKKHTSTIASTGFQRELGCKHNKVMLDRVGMNIEFKR